MSSATITFHGGAGSVTGVNFLLDTGKVKVLVDCGVREREQMCDPANYGAFPYDPKEIDALVVTHAHADHIGRIPKLVRDGFRGAIHSTAATKDLTALMFDDALEIMKREGDRYGCGVLYEQGDAAKALSLWRGHAYHEPFDTGDARVEFLDAGHILGSAMVKMTRRTDSHSESVLGRTILFTGDLGNSPEPLLNDTESPAGAHYIVMESVYGDRVHEKREERRERLRTAIERARARGGMLLIPSFSIERTQILLFELNEMVESGSMQAIPVYLDAPLAIRVTDVYRHYADLLNPHVRSHFTSGDDPFAFSGLTEIVQAKDSEVIHRMPNPKVIIAGAGMSHGGRIRAHERRYLDDREAEILFVGYQAPGSLGRRIEEGEKRVHIDGERVNVRARIETLTGYSGHRDRDGLMQFVEDAGETLEKVFVTMGEPKSALFLAQRIRDFLDVDAETPEAGQSFDINW